jgi:hypothetical protein
MIGSLMGISKTLYVLGAAFAVVAIANFAIRLLLRLMSARIKRRVSWRLILAYVTQAGFLGVVVVGMLELGGQALHQDTMGLSIPTTAIAIVVAGFAAFVKVGKIIFLRDQEREVIEQAEGFLRDNGGG